MSWSPCVWFDAQLRWCFGSGSDVACVLSGSDLVSLFWEFMVSGGMPPLCYIDYILFWEFLALEL